MVPIQAPKALPLILDDTFDYETGLQEIPVRHAFTGPDLRISVTGGHAHYDPDSGCVLVPTDRAHMGETLQVTARNAAGQCHLDINVTVEPEEAELILASSSSSAPIGPAQTQMQSRLKADGVEFRFAQAAPTGRFITGANGEGDPFVVGPVRLLGYSPGPKERQGRAMNGAMLNPPCGRFSGFDSYARKNTYKAELNAGLNLPLDLVPGDSLIVTVSNPKAENHKQTADHFVVLTCVADVPFADSFRPPYCGPEKPMWRLSDIDPGVLGKLSSVSRGKPPNQAELESRFKRFAIEISSTWNRDHLRGVGHAQTYGRDLCQEEAAPYLWANLNLPYARKEKIVAGLVQRGIDRYGALRSARVAGFQPWQADGAHHSGRKFSILFAGRLLGDPAMLSVMKQVRGADGAEASWFHEDAMAFHVTQEVVDISNSPDWQPAYANDPKKPKQPYSTNMIGMPDWRGKALNKHVNAAWTGHPYRIAGNANTQHAQVLSALVMGLQKAWGHDAYFDYHIRYMDIMASRPDPFQFRGSKQARYNPVEGSKKRGGWDGWMQYWKEEWAWHMLMAYRAQLYRFPWQV